MMADGGLRAMAAEILPELPRLLGDELAAEVGALVCRALADPREEAETELVDTLSRHEPTREWMWERVSTAERLRDYTPLPGLSLGAPVRYACPVCAREWFRAAPDDEVPACDRHGDTPVRYVPS